MYTETKMKSLLIIGVPRSATTALYKVVQSLLQGTFAIPWEGKSASFGGEYLPHTILPKSISEEKYHEQAFKILNQFSSQRLMKYAREPVLLGKYFKQYPSVWNTLYIERNTTDCIHRILARKWITPLYFYNRPNRYEYTFFAESMCKTYEWSFVEKHYLDDMIRALLFTQAFYKEIATQTISYHNFIEKESVLFSILEEMKYPIHKTKYLTEEFVNIRQEALLIRTTPKWQELNARVEKLRIEQESLLKEFKESL